MGEILQHDKRERDEENDTCSLTVSCENLGLVPTLVRVGMGTQGRGSREWDKAG